MKKLARLDHQYLWHPFTQMRDWLKADPILTRIPVLFFSAGVGPEETAQLRLAYADDHLQKPATREQVLAAVVTLLTRRHRF